MNFRYLVTSLSLSLISATLLADSTLNDRSTRLDSMELNNYMTKDSFNFFFNPANIATAKTSAFLELGLNENGGSNAQDSTERVNGFAGIMLDGGNAGNFGVVLNRKNSALDGFANTTDTKQNNLDLFYGKAISKLNLGMRLSYVSIDNSDSNSTLDQRVLVNAGNYNQNTDNRTSNAHTLEASDLSLQFGAQFMGFDATILYGMYSYSDKTNAQIGTVTYDTPAANSDLSSIFASKLDEEVTSNGASIFETALAYTHDINEQSLIIGYGVYSTTDYSVTGTRSLTEKTELTNSTNVKEAATSEANSHTIDTILIGASYNLHPTKDVLLVLAGEYTNTVDTVGYSNTITKNNSLFTDTSVTPNTTHTTNLTTGALNTPDDSTITVNDISLTLAAEAMVTESLALRFGLRESIYYNYDKSDTDKTFDEVFANDDAVIDGSDTSSATSSTVADTSMGRNEYYNRQNDMQIAIGFGYNLTDKVVLDGLVNANLFLTGPNFISGENLTNVNARLALNYNF